MNQFTKQEQMFKEVVKKFLAEGYVVAVKNPYSTDFNLRYSVYKEFPNKCDKRYVFTDKDGKPISAQG